MSGASSRQSVFTMSEAAYALRDDVKAVTRLVDEHPDLVSKTVIGKRGRRVLSETDLIYMSAARALREVLTPTGRRQLHEALQTTHSQHEVAFGQLRLPLEPFRKEVHERLVMLAGLKASTDGDPDDPCIRGTDIAVYRIAALLAGGASMDDVRQDYPSLRQEQIEHARDYALAMPKKGRPYPGKSFKRATQELDLHLIDTLLAQENLDDEQ